MLNNVMVHKYKNKYIQMEIKCMISIVMMLQLKPENHLPCTVMKSF